MNKPPKRSDPGKWIHAGVGLVIGGLATGFGGAEGMAAAPLLAAAGTAREYHQHRKDQTHRWTRHRIAEGLAWGVGGLVGGVVGLLARR